MAATLAGAPAAVKLLLAEGADAAVAENDGYNPPHGAGFQGRAEVLRELVKAGVGIHNKHKDGFYPIHRACWGMDARHTDTVKAFIEAGEPHDLAADNGQTCRDMTRNEGTRRMLEAVRDQKGEL
jgi:ankyrin repeat protein